MRPDKYLKEHGPATRDEIGVSSISAQEKQHGVHKFNPKAAYAGSVVQGGGNKIAVYYLPTEHAPRDVITAWLDTNEKTVQAISSQALHHRIASYGDTWREVSYELLGPFENHGGYGTSGGTSNQEACPFCGESMTTFPNHVDRCEEV